MAKKSVKKTLQKKHELKIIPRRNTYDSCTTWIRSDLQGTLEYLIKMLPENSFSDDTTAHGHIISEALEMYFKHKGILVADTIEITEVKKNEITEVKKIEKK